MRVAALGLFLALYFLFGGKEEGQKSDASKTPLEFISRAQEFQNAKAEELPASGTRSLAADKSALPLSQERVRDSVLREKDFVEDLEERWDFSPVEDRAGEYKEFFRESEPDRVLFQTGERTVEIQAQRRANKQSGKNLYLVDEEGLAETQKRKRSRSRSLEGQTRAKLSDDSSGENAQDRSGEIALSHDSYHLHEFDPGDQDERSMRIRVPESLHTSIYGPDFDETAEIDEPYEDSEALRQLRATVLSLGHHGEVTIAVSEGGFIRNLPGPDFKIFENVLKVSRRAYYREFARVGVAWEDVDAAYRWFECQPELGIIDDCAGTLPSRGGDGGDAFDLELVGLDRVRYIKIRDVGSNENRGTGNHTEGFDLDALFLFHAFR